MTDRLFFSNHTVTDVLLPPLMPQCPSLTAWTTTAAQPRSDGVTPHCGPPLNWGSNHNLVTPTPISKSNPCYLHHHHLLIITKSAVSGLLSDMATRRVFHLNSNTHVFQPQPITNFNAHIGMYASLCTHTLEWWGEHTLRFISPLLSLLAAGTITLTQTQYFCHRPRDVVFS